MHGLAQVKSCPPEGQTVALSCVVVWCLGRPPLFVSQHWRSSVPYWTLTNRGVKWTSLNLTRGSDFGERFFNKSESHRTGPQIPIPAIAVSPFMHTPFHSLTLRKPDVSAELVSAGSVVRERSQRQNLKPTLNSEDYIETLGSGEFCSRTSNTAFWWQSSQKVFSKCVKYQK
jgi:hypothetical protein